MENPSPKIDNPQKSRNVDVRNPSVDQQTDGETLRNGRKLVEEICAI